MRLRNAQCSVESYHLLLVFWVGVCLSYSPIRSAQTTSTRIFSTTSFEADYYGDENTVNPYLDDRSRIAAPADTKLVLGFNKYSHDTSICAADAKTGEVLFAMSKERLTRKKHDAGNVALLVEKCLDCLELDYSAIEKVVINNHHHRVLPREENRRHMEWECGLCINGGIEDGYDDEENLLNGAEKLEMSHHLAHAYSAATQSPFDSGMVVVMDGMGETYRTMLCAHQTDDKSYTSDLSFGLDSFECIPSDLNERVLSSVFDWREAESIYVFTKESNTIDIKPVFKRFQEELTPPTLYNHGFENMDSLGALYSRASSHILGDWNACGKVMGLAPWIDHTWMTEEGSKLKPIRLEERIVQGKLYSEDEDYRVRIDRSAMMGTPHCARNDPDLFDEDGMRRKRYNFDDDGELYRALEQKKPVMRDDDDDDDEEEEDHRELKRLPAKVALEAISLASRIQDDLEEVAIDFVKHYKEKTGATNLCLAGGVALNSVLNGRLSRELGFEETYIPPYPGDDGVAVGCCAFGLYGNPNLRAGDGNGLKPPVWDRPLSPYLGPFPTEGDLRFAIEGASPWLEVETIRKDELRIERIVNEIQSGGIVALYHGRSEVGPRALGHRSILADPRQKQVVRFINEYVKKREGFRPFAPSVLAEEAAEWFDLGVTADNNVSPYMSVTAMVKQNKRPLIPAVTHVDGSSRLQTVTKDSDPFYYELISKFFRRTKVPMVLNTSFNTIPAEPIVETPFDAVKSFLNSMGSVDLLVMGDYVIKRKVADVKALLGEGRAQKVELLKEAKAPKRTGAVEFKSSFKLKRGRSDDEMEGMAVTHVRMPARPMHHDDKNNWFELTDELEGELLAVCDGTHTINDIMGFFTARPEDDQKGDDFYKDTRTLFEQISRRLIRMYQHTLISW